MSIVADIERAFEGVREERRQADANGTQTANGTARVVSAKNLTEWLTRWKEAREAGIPCYKHDEPGQMRLGFVESRNMIHHVIPFVRTKGVEVPQDLLEFFGHESVASLMKGRDDLFDVFED